LADNLTTVELLMCHWVGDSELKYFSVALFT